LIGPPGGKPLSGAAKSVPTVAARFLLPRRSALYLFPGGAFSWSAYFLYLPKFLFARPKLARSTGTGSRLEAWHRLVASRVAHHCLSVAPAPAARTPDEQKPP